MSAHILDVRLTSAPSHEIARGLLGYVSARYGDLLLDGVTLRRTGDGRLALSWPARRDGKGRDHAVVRPRDDETRRVLEREILAAIALGEVKP